MWHGGTSPRAAGGRARHNPDTQGAFGVSPFPFGALLPSVAGLCERGQHPGLVATSPPAAPGRGREGNVPPGGSAGGKIPAGRPE